MAPHRTIPQRLSDHDARFEEQERIIADLLTRLAALEKPAKTPRGEAAS